MGLGAVRFDFYILFRSSDVETSIEVETLRLSTVYRVRDLYKAVFFIYLDDKVERIRWRRPSPTPFVVSDGPSGGCRDSVDPHLTHTQ